MGEPRLIEPMRSARSRKVRPGSCAVSSGGSSSPVKWRSGSPVAVSAGAIWMYEPDSSVSRPEMEPAKSRGLTTQKRACSVSSGSAARVVRTVMTTCPRSGDSAISCTVPITTSR